MSVFIIAEIGVNHNGDLNLAKKMILEAKKAGVDAVKFQSFKADKLVSKDAKKADNQIKNTEKDESQYNMIKKLELTEQDHIYLKNICDEENIKFLSSPFDIESAELLISLGIDTVKIPSGEITNLPYLEAIGKIYKNIILSTGMSNLEEVKEAINILNKYGERTVITYADYIISFLQYTTSFSFSSLRHYIKYVILSAERRDTFGKNNFSY